MVKDESTVSAAKTYFIVGVHREKSGSSSRIVGLRTNGQNAYCIRIIGDCHALGAPSTTIGDGQVPVPPCRLSLPTSADIEFAAERPARVGTGYNNFTCRALSPANTAQSVGYLAT